MRLTSSFEIFGYFVIAAAIVAAASLLGDGTFFDTIWSFIWGGVTLVMLTLAHLFGRSAHKVVMLSYGLGWVASVVVRDLVSPGSMILFVTGTDATYALLFAIFLGQRMWGAALSFLHYSMVFVHLFGSWSPAYIYVVEGVYVLGLLIIALDMFKEPLLVAIEKAKAQQTQAGPLPENHSSPREGETHLMDDLQKDEGF